MITISANYENFEIQLQNREKPNSLESELKGKTLTEKWNTSKTLLREQKLLT